VTGEGVAAPLVFVTVGTDHHPFDRLIRWVDSWLAGDGAPAARCFVQSGATPPPRMAEWKAFLGGGEMETMMGRATAVVCHGGPGTIMGCRRLGIVPIVVPRRHALGEHVDDHQGAFTRMLGTRGEIELADGEEQFRATLASALRDPQAFRRAGSSIDRATVAEHFEQLIEQLVEGRTGRRFR